jgi:putative FmdB family regulatory protein
MPTYEYKCYVCNNVFDVEQRITEDPLKTCKFCGGPVHRVISAAGIIFKGSGFHVTDYGTGSKPAAAPKTKGKEKKAESPDASVGGNSKPKADSGKKS